MEDDFQPGGEGKIKIGTYQHYKGNKYSVIGVATHSETLEDMVVYVALHEQDKKFNQMWVRPLAMFNETVEVEGETIPRFTYIGTN